MAEKSGGVKPLVTAAKVAGSTTDWGGSNTGGKAKFASARKYPDLQTTKNQKGPKPAY